MLPIEAQTKTEVFPTFQTTIVRAIVHWTETK